MRKVIELRPYQDREQTRKRESLLDGLNWSVDLYERGDRIGGQAPLKLLTAEDDIRLEEEEEETS